MNKIYRVIWNRVFNRFVVVDEFTQARGKISHLSNNRVDSHHSQILESFRGKFLPVVGAILLTFSLGGAMPMLLG